MNTYPAKTIVQPTTVRVGSTPGIYSPGVWNWFISGALRGRDDAWMHDFLRAFTRDRLDRHQREAVLAGDYSAAIENETVVITVPKSA